MTPPGVASEYTFESAIVTELTGSLGWSAGSQGHYNPELALDTAELFAFLGATQAQAWNRIRDSFQDPNTAQREFARHLAAQIDKYGALDVLRHGVRMNGVSIQLAYFRPGHTLAVDALHEYNANRLTVTRQLRYSVKDAGKSLDLALFVNGIPVATVELKNPLTGQTVEDAKLQYRTTRDPRELIFAKRTLVHFAVDPELVFLTTRLAGKKTRFLPFNLGSNGPGVDGAAGNPASPDGYRTSYLWRTIWQRDAWLELLQRFLHVAIDTKKKSNRSSDPHNSPVIFPRLHQWHAVQHLVQHARTHGAGSNYLVQHSAGSGKSNTIAWLAHHLSSLHTPENPADLASEARAAGLVPNTPVFDKVVVVTDRIVLDRQLQDTIYQFEHVTGVVKQVTEGSSDLADALTGSTARIIITTLQKFPHILHKVSQLGTKRYAIIVDEAHSSQSGESAAKLKKALGAYGGGDIDSEGDLLTSSALARGRQPNLSYFAFTATPKNKTLDLFGVKDPVTGAPRPFHVYSMQQAIDEGFILDVLKNYTTYKALWRLQNDAVEEAEQADPRVDPKKASAKLVRMAVLNPASQAQHAKAIVDHFHQNVARRLGGRAKAMVVTSSREHALKLFQAIKSYVEQRGFNDCQPLVAFSGTLDIDGIEYTESKLNGFSEAALPEQFGYTKADDPLAAARNQTEYRILVVADKYQTGFDQPLLTAMYVCKKLAYVAAVQTLSRLNRIHPAKDADDVFALDFVNTAQDIQDAFRPFFQTTITEESNPNLLYDLQRTVMDFRLFDVPEMDAFLVPYFAAEEATDPKTREKLSAQFYRSLDSALDRFAALSAVNRDEAEEFRGALRDYTNAYSHYSQYIGFADADLERLYLYARQLSRALPPVPGKGVDVGDTELTHFRLERTGQTDLSLTAAEEQAIAPFAPLGGLVREAEEKSLGEVIEDLNQRFGVDLGTADKIFFLQNAVSLMEDEQLKQLALMSDQDKFEQAADEKIQMVVAENHENNTTLVVRYFDDTDFQAAYNDAAKKLAYKLIRDPLRDQALRELRAAARAQTEH